MLRSSYLAINVIEAIKAISIRPSKHERRNREENPVYGAKATRAREAIGEHNNRIKKAEIIQKREETNKNSRSIVITPFDGDRKELRQIQESANVESVVVWKDRPSATPNFNTFNGVKILPLFTEAQRMNHKRKVQEREDALFERLSNKRKVGVGEQQKGTK
uniref:Uncharacterized protein n=1 Tax=Ditylenchus dipsaci TaxID=166011 RepID=A0A915DJ42_9BILA